MNTAGCRIYMGYFRDMSYILIGKETVRGPKACGVVCAESQLDMTVPQLSFITSELKGRK